MNIFFGIKANVLEDCPGITIKKGAKIQVNGYIDYSEEYSGNDLETDTKYPLVLELLEDLQINDPPFHLKVKPIKLEETIKKNKDYWFSKFTSALKSAKENGKNKIDKDIKKTGEHLRRLKEIRAELNLNPNKNYAKRKAKKKENEKI